MFYKNLLIFLRKIYKICYANSKITQFRNNYILCNKVVTNNEKGSKILYNYLKNNKPCLITRFGRHEINILLNYCGINNKKFNSFDFIRGKIYENWWHPNKCKFLKNNAGFYPTDSQSLKKFSQLYIKHMNHIDVLSVFTSNPEPENFFRKKLNHTVKINLESLSIFSSKFAWTKALKNKKVLIISPFTDTIKKQFIKKNKIFKDKRVPNFKLKTLKSVVSLGGINSEFKNWFEALDFMKSKIKKIDFDIAIIGCGAYGYPLAAYVKEIGKIGFHIGGELQTIFGILGKRFENPKHKNGMYLKFINKHWTRPSKEERPKFFKNIEGGAYW